MPRTCVQVNSSAVGADAGDGTISASLLLIREEVHLLDLAAELEELRSALDKVGFGWLGLWGWAVGGSRQGLCMEWVHESEHRQAGLFRQHAGCWRCLTLVAQCQLFGGCASLDPGSQQRR